ncbi:MAG: tetratricopeptide repeat protein [Myxococcota bacterium]
MARRRRRSTLAGTALALATLAGTLGPLVSPARAQVVLSEKPRSREVRTTSQAFNAKLQAVNDLLVAEKYVRAAEAADTLARRRGLSDYERALVWQLRAYIAYGGEDVDAAIEAFEKCLALDALPLATQRDLQHDLGQLYMAAERPDAAIVTLEDWIAHAESPSANTHYLAGLAHARKEQWERASQHAARAVALTDTPRPAWLQLLLACHLEQQKWRESARVLERLIAVQPKKAWWMQLASVYAELGEGERSLATLELAHREGMLDRPSEIENLAQLYLAHSVPIKAARLLEREIAEGRLEASAENLELLGDAWMLAREFEAALPPLVRAAELSDEGKVHLRLAQVYAEREEWPEARRNVVEALAKGGLRDPAEAQLLSGIAHYHVGQRDAARRAFERASASEATRDQARSWLEFLALDAGNG